MNFEIWFREKHGAKISAASTEAVLKLAEDGATIPFMARYRKEQTGGLDEVQIQAVLDSKERWDTLIKRQAYIIEEIDRQKKLTPELKDQVLATFEPQALEDLYLPYKVKRKTKAALAREAGLEPLADWIWNCGHGTEIPQPGQTLEIWAFTFRNEEKGFNDAAAAIAGALDILVERLSETQELRSLVRTTLFEKGHLRTGKGPKPKNNSKYENYFQHDESVASLLKPENSHRYLAIRRGWMEEELSLGIGGSSLTDGTDAGKEDPAFELTLLSAFENAALSEPDFSGADALRKAARLAYKAHVFPSIESEVHKALKEVADPVAIQVFAENVKKLLLASPFGPKAVLGVDPGIRTGCKIAVVDDSGKYIASTVMHLQTDDQKTKAVEMLHQLFTNGQGFEIRAVAVGNGTAGRETEIFVRKALTEKGHNVPVVMVSESGASVYSASEIAREEFPELDLTIRGAISIARRLQDPLAELVKVDPKSIGVGQYQHDVSPHALKRSLDVVVDSCVNQVGVNLNTASSYLLARVSGIGPGLAKAIVEYRSHKGLFKSRQELLDVARFTKKAFEQGAGFLRIPDAENPLDNTGVHPERYEALQGLATRLGKNVRDFVGAGASLLRKELGDLKTELGEFTFDDVVQELEKPGRDPREEFVPFQYRDDIHELKDLKKDMVCPGIVTNVTNFGAFVDIGVHQDGLVHISQLSSKYVKDPREAVSPGDRVMVRVLDVLLEKNQISLSIKAAQESNGARDSKGKSDRAPRAQHERGAKTERGERGPRVRREPKAPKLTRTADPSLSPVSPRVPGQAPPVAPHGAGAMAAHRSGPPKVKPAAPKQVFNNAFAGLAGLKSSLKPK